jgi:hypothetical protein
MKLSTRARHVGLPLAIAAAAFATTASAATWRVQPSAGLSGLASAPLSGVSCPTTSWCVAAGGASTGPAIAADWDGTAWSATSVPQSGHGTLSAVSCVSAAFCVAVGDVAGRSTTQGRIAVWNDLVWVGVSGPKVRSLDGVSCVTTTFCVAVGASDVDGHATTLFWNGRRWRDQAPASPGSGRLADLRGVSCTAPDACTAVGVRQRASKAFTLAPLNTILIERWDGRHWIRQSAPDVRHDYGALSAISCPTRTSCTAVGDVAVSQGDASGAFSERWNGTRWSITTAGLPASLADHALLGSVACTTSTSCTAVGGKGEAGPTPSEPLVETWTAGHWSPEATPHEPFAELNAISCAAATACTAVGDTESQAALIESDMSPTPSGVT